MQIRINPIRIEHVFHHMNLIAPVHLDVSFNRVISNLEGLSICTVWPLKWWNYGHYLIERTIFKWG